MGHVGCSGQGNNISWPEPYVMPNIQIFTVLIQYSIESISIFNVGCRGAVQLGGLVLGSP